MEQIWPFSSFSENIRNSFSHPCNCVFWETSVLKNLEFLAQQNGTISQNFCAAATFLLYLNVDKTTQTWFLNLSWNFIYRSRENHRNRSIRLVFVVGQSCTLLFHNCYHLLLFFWDNVQVFACRLPVPHDRPLLLWFNICWVLVLRCLAWVFSYVACFCKRNILFFSGKFTRLWKIEQHMLISSVHLGHNFWLPNSSKTIPSLPFHKGVQQSSGQKDICHITKLTETQQKIDR